MKAPTLRPSDSAEEALEQLWIELFEGNRLSIPVNDPSLKGVEDGLVELFQEELARLRGGLVELTPRGYEQAKMTVRRHRLAERLLTDVLDIDKEKMDIAACGIEHSLREGVDEAVCTLLGHPDRCPHGKPIPPGECCERASQQIDRQVRPLCNMYPGQNGRIAYVQTGEAKKLQKLMAMGVLPGKGLHLIQGFPSYVFQVGHSQFAVDEDLARAIFVRVESK